MIKSREAIIEGETYTAILSPDGKLAYIYDVLSEDEADFMGTFDVKDSSLIQYLPMPYRAVVIGHLKPQP